MNRVLGRRFYFFQPLEMAGTTCHQTLPLSPHADTNPGRVRPANTISGSHLQTALSPEKQT